MLVDDLTVGFTTGLFGFTQDGTDGGDGDDEDGGDDDADADLTGADAKAVAAASYRQSRGGE
jgi:hypothetical protein